MEKFSLVGVDSNAFNVIGYTINAMKKVKCSEEDIKKYQKLATSSDYSNLIVCSQEQIDKCNKMLKGEKSYGTEVFAKFGPGKYFIGDICYALPEDTYDEVWGGNNYQDGVYEDFAVHRTAYGDGCFVGSDGVSYAVDAGNIGITNIIQDQRYTDEELNRLGKVVQVEKALIMNCDDNGNFEFTVDDNCIEIITDGSDNEDDNDDEEESEIVSTHHTFFTNNEDSEEYYEGTLEISKNEDGTYSYNETSTDSSDSGFKTEEEAVDAFREFAKSEWEIVQIG